MTTIVFDGHCLAADTRGTLGLGASGYKRHCTECGERVTNSHIELRKIHIPERTTLFEGEVVIAIAGAGSSKMCTFMTYLVESHPDPLAAVRKFPATTHQENAALLILTEQNVYEMTASGRLIKHQELPVAIGTGALAAMLAVKEGATAAQAVRKAALVDPATNDVVDIVRMRADKQFRVVRLCTAEDLSKKTF